MTDADTIVLMAAIAVPLVLALLAPLFSRPLRLLPWAAVPALVAAFAVPHGAPVAVPLAPDHLWLVIDGTGWLFLAGGALLWMLAGVFARVYFGDSRPMRIFCSAWMLTLAGTLGTFIAADVVTFYVAFSLMSLSAWVLVTHDRTAAAFSAGRVYILLAVAGEVVLLVALAMAAAQSQSLMIDDMRLAIAESASRDFIVAGIVIGFAIKTGLAPLHVWLPLAHPVAPTPASAVLSGVIVKTGIVGLLRLAPFDTLTGLWIPLLIAIGLTGLFSAAVIGFVQHNPKRVLAYSTVSQAGLVLVVIAAASQWAAPAEVSVVVSLYAATEGLAKGALFLAVGVAALHGLRVRLLLVSVSLLLGLSVAGLPLTGGALAKLAVKDLLADHWLTWVIPLSSIATGLVMLRFVERLSATRGHGNVRSGPAGIAAPWLLLALAAIGLPWVVSAGGGGQSVSVQALWSGLWPVLLAVTGWPLARRLAGPVAAGSADGEDRWGAMTQRLLAAVTRGEPLAALEQRMLRWSISGPLILVVAAAVALSLL
jgi:hydrogenase-4 component B